MLQFRYTQTKVQTHLPNSQKYKSCVEVMINSILPVAESVPPVEIRKSSHDAVASSCLPRSARGSVPFPPEESRETQEKVKLGEVTIHVYLYC